MQDMETEDSSVLISISETARMLQVAVDTLRRWDKNGKLKAVRLPNGYRKYRLSDIKKILKEFDNGSN